MPVPLTTGQLGHRTVCMFGFAPHSRAFLQGVRKRTVSQEMTAKAQTNIL